AATNPAAIKRETVDPAAGFQAFMGREMAFAVGLTGELLRPATALMAGLYRLFVEKDCSLAEINPLVVTKDNRILAVDAKINFDDNALYRHPDILAMPDQNEEEPLE